MWRCRNSNECQIKRFDEIFCYYELPFDMLREMFDISLHTPVLFVHQQELCAEAQSVSPKELGEDEGETGAA